MRNALWMGLVLAIAGCTPATPEPSWATGDARIDEDHHAPLPIGNVHDIMTAKLAHAHALLEGIAIGDYRQVEANAIDLQRLSREAGWRVHTTVAYGLFSDEFGDAAGEVAAAARQQDAKQVADRYAGLIATCVRCHDYMSSEGLYRDQPGAVSLRLTRPAPLGMPATTP